MLTETIRAFAELGRLRQRQTTRFANFADPIPVTDAAILTDIRRELETEAGRLNRVYDVTLNADTNTFQGRADQRVSLGKVQVYIFTITPDQMVYKLVNAVEMAEFAESEAGQAAILNYAARSGRKLKCRAGNIQCGGKCQKGTMNCSNDMPPAQEERVRGLLDRAKALVKSKVETIKVKISGKVEYGKFEPLDPAKHEGKIGHAETLPLKKNRGAVENLEYDPSENPEDAKHPERQVKNWREISKAIGKATGFDKEESVQSMLDAMKWSQLGYKEIRAVQQGREPDSYYDFKDKDDAARAAKQLDRLVDKLPKYEGVIYRGLSFKNPREADGFINALQQKGEMKMDTLASWTTDQDKGRGFATGNSGTSGVVLQVANRKNGASINQLSAWSEAEVLTRTGAQYRVQGMQRRRMGLLGRRVVWEVVLEEV